MLKRSIYEVWILLVSLQCNIKDWQKPYPLPKVPWHMETSSHNIFLLVLLGPVWWPWDIMTLVIFLQLFQFFTASKTTCELLCAILLHRTSVGWHLGCALPNWEAVWWQVGEHYKTLYLRVQPGGALSFIESSLSIKILLELYKIIVWNKVPGATERASSEGKVLQCAQTRVQCWSLLLFYCLDVPVVNFALWVHLNKGDVASSKKFSHVGMVKQNLNWF